MKKKIVIFFSAVIMASVFILSFPPLEYRVYKLGLIGKPILKDIEIKMKDGWYMSFHSEYGIGKIVYLLKRDKRKGIFKGQPYLVFSKLKGWAKEKEITFTKIQITDKLYQEYKKISESVKTYPWGKVIILKNEVPTERSKEYYYVLMREKQLVIITSDLESLNEIKTVEKIRD